MSLYLGEKKVGTNSTIVKEVPKEKFGATVDTFFGDVDANGNYTKPTQYPLIDLSGVKSVPASGMSYLFNHKKISGVVANDVTSVGISAFANFNSSSYSRGDEVYKIEFNGLEEITAQGAFLDFFSGNAYLDVRPVIRFIKLRVVNGNQIFYNAFPYEKIVPDETFPSLEEIAGNTNPFYNFSALPTDKIFKFSKLKKITGATSSTYATFKRSSKAIWHLPSVVDISGYVFDNSGTSEIHFAAANQAAIEACPNYANKWGATNATIYFDL